MHRFLPDGSQSPLMELSPEAYPLQLSQPTTTRQAKTDARYEAIIAAAEQMIHDRGYHAVSTRDLARSVGIKMSSLYYYFESKEQILFDISRRTMESLIRITEDAFADQEDADVAQRLRKAVSVGVEFHITHQAAAGVVLSEGRKLNGQFRAELRRLLRAYENIFRSLVEEGIESGVFTRTDPVMATYIIMSALTRISIWYRPNSRLDASEIAATYSDLLVRMMLELVQKVSTGFETSEHQMNHSDVDEPLTRVHPPRVVLAQPPEPG
jgi:AcrR family transcriptional regulator